MEEKIPRVKKVINIEEKKNIINKRYGHGFEPPFKDEGTLPTAPILQSLPIHINNTIYVASECIVLCLVTKP